MVFTLNRPIFISTTKSYYLEKVLGVITLIGLPILWIVLLVTLFGMGPWKGTMEPLGWILVSVATLVLFIMSLKSLIFIK